MNNLREKINGLFILGYEGSDFRKNSDFVNLLKSGLGGVIFFTQNILGEEEFKSQVKLIKSVANENSQNPPLFLSIDEEGGRVERFENINKDYAAGGKIGKKYLSARYIANKGEIALAEQTLSIANDIKKFGLNMNFAPVLDVNSNPNNPIIGERAYSSEPKEVAKFALLTDKIYRENGIITVGKHFPGHGDTKKDSHLELPTVDLSFEELEKTHIYPFKKAIEAKIPALMVAHVHYDCFDGISKNIPASKSKNVLNYLRENLNFEGLIISDDMEMGGIKSQSKLETVKEMLKNGVNCFIYRTCNKEVIQLLEDLEQTALLDNELKTAIEKNYYKVLSTKKKFFVIMVL